MAGAEWLDTQGRGQYGYLRKEWTKIDGTGDGNGNGSGSLHGHLAKPTDRPAAQPSIMTADGGCG